MTITTPIARTQKNTADIKYERVAVATNVTIIKGMNVLVNTTTGRATFGNAATGRRFLGVAQWGDQIGDQTVVGNTGGTKYVTVAYDYQQLMPCKTALGAARVGSNAFVAASADGSDTVTTATGAGTAGVRIAVGEVMAKEAALLAWVFVRKYSVSST